jgi:hypothetical protein
VLGVAAAAIRIARPRLPAAEAISVLGLPVLAGLLGVAVALAALMLTGLS